VKSNTLPKIGIIGSGRLGTAVAKAALTAGYEVRIANSKGPESLKLITSVLLPGAKPCTVEDVVSLSDMIIFAIPLNKYRLLPHDLFKGKLIIDAMNYWPPTEGAIQEFETQSSSEFIQSFFKDSIVIKSLNHVAYNELKQHSLPDHKKGRRIILLAGNDVAAKHLVEEFIDSIGFESYDMGELKNGVKFQPDTILFNTRYTKTELEKLLKVS
jgi:predicted dinucleotide-binding enzyme